MNVSGLYASNSPYRQTADPTRQGGKPSEKNPANASTHTDGMTQEQLALIDKLKLRDQQVRQHEQAHMAAAGGLATSGASFTYQKGPNGVDYAIGGEVGIDISPGATPEETRSRAQRIRAAALAPADPSGPDLAIAAKAAQMERQASMLISSQSTDNGASEKAQTDHNRAQLSKHYSTTDTSASRVNVYA